MLVIRMQRTGRRGHAQFRVVVQDSRTAPSSGRIVAYIGSYNPHTKALTVDKEKVEFYLKNGARPSDRAARLFKTEKIKLPEWFSPAPARKSAIKSTEKLRRNRPEEPKAKEAPAEEAKEETPAEQPAETAEAEIAEEKPASEAKAEPAETEAETPAEEAKN